MDRIVFLAFFALCLLNASVLGGVIDIDVLVNVGCSNPPCDDDSAHGPCKCCPPNDCNTEPPTGGCKDEKGEYHMNGSNWNDPDSPCYFYSCENGIIYTAIEDCAPPPCSDPVSVPGECCPRCDDTTECQEGSSWPDPTDPCCFHSCIEGRRETSCMACMAPSCDAELIYTPGNCCPDFRCRTTTSTAAPLFPAPNK